MEIYCPHFVCYQFGLIQSIPFPLVYTLNSNFLNRLVVHDLDEVDSVDNIFRALRQDFTISPIQFLPSATAEFLVFWGDYIKLILSADSVVALNTFFTHKDSDHSAFSNNGDTDQLSS